MTLEIVVFSGTAHPKVAEGACAQLGVSLDTNVIVELLDGLHVRNVRRIVLAFTHGLFTGGAAERLSGHTDLDEIVTTDTVPLSADKAERLPGLSTRSVAPLFAEAIRRIHCGESVSSLFDNPSTDN